MKRYYFFFLLLTSVFVFSQETISDVKKTFAQCKTSSCKIANAIAIAAQYLDIDQLSASQKWLDYSKKMLSKHPDDEQSYIVMSLQSEVFYYSGLYQFGVHEAHKAIAFAMKNKDSLFLSNAYLMEGVNWFEIGEITNTEAALQNARNYFPNKLNTKYKRFNFNKEFIYNNIAQLKIKKTQLDSAVFYNTKAYKYAQQTNNKRGVANVERTFGELYLKQNKKDSAEIYFNKSLETSINAAIYDTALLAYGNLVECCSKNSGKSNFYYEKGNELIIKHNVNAAFQKLFYEQALAAFQSVNNKDLIVSTQGKLLFIEKNINKNGNLYVQNIADQYINTEYKLLRSKINELDKQKNIKILQQIAMLFLGFILVLIIVIIRRKNRLQQLILDQKNEISKDLHDDIGSELSSILINTNLLKNFDPNDKQKILIDKISNTSAEISQRLNAFIWSLNTDNNNIQNFSEYVKLYAYKFLDGTEINFNFSDNTDSISTKILNGNARKNLFFCIKEALNNCVKHANATKISITISSLDKKALLILIQDNGKGMQEVNKFGNGLVNIKKRVAHLKGDLKIESSNGLKISIKVPL